VALGPSLPVVIGVISFCARPSAVVAAAGAEPAEATGYVPLGPSIRGALPVIIGFVLVAAVFVVLANLIVDLCYTLLDPRVRIK
jgi:hypothetical protein